MADAERKGLRIPVISDVAGALKNTTDLKGALQATVGGAEVAALLYALSLPDSTERVALGGLVGISSALILLAREKLKPRK